MFFRRGSVLKGKLNFVEREDMLKRLFLSMNKVYCEMMLVTVGSMLKRDGFKFLFTGFYGVCIVHRTRGFGFIVLYRKLACVGVLRGIVFRAASLVGVRMKPREKRRRRTCLMSKWRSVR